MPLCTISFQIGVTELQQNEVTFETRYLVLNYTEKVPLLGWFRIRVNVLVQIS